MSTWALAILGIIALLAIFIFFELYKLKKKYGKKGYELLKSLNWEIKESSDFYFRRDKTDISYFCKECFHNGELSKLRLKLMVNNPSPKERFFSFWPVCEKCGEYAYAQSFRFIAKDGIPRVVFDTDKFDEVPEWFERDIKPYPY